jgi:hypothetical protein
MESCRSYSKYFLMIFPAIMVVVCCSWTQHASPAYNRNTWVIRIGKKVVFNSSMHKLGDTVSVNRTLIMRSDTLYTGLWFCGDDAKNSRVTLTIKDEEHRVIKEYSHQLPMARSYWAKIACRDIVAVPEFKTCKMMEIYFTIDELSEKSPVSYLVGNISLK